MLASFTRAIPDLDKSEHKTPNIFFFFPFFFTLLCFFLRSPSLFPPSSSLHTAQESIVTLSHPTNPPSSSKRLAFSSLSFLLSLSHSSSCSSHTRPQHNSHSGALSAPPPTHTHTSRSFSRCPSFTFASQLFPPIAALQSPGRTV